MNRLPAPNRTHYLYLALALLVLTAYGSLIPLKYQPLPASDAFDRFRGMPYEDMNQTDLRADWIVNAVQYATLCFCWLAALSVDRRPFVRWLMAGLVIPAGWAVAINLEFLQIYFPPRTVSFNDLLVEGLGAVAGVAGWLLVGQPFTNWARRFWNGKGLAELAAQALPGYMIVLLVVHLMPFDVVFRVAELQEKIRSGHVQLVPFRRVESVWHLVTNVLAFLPLGILLSLAPGGARRGWPWFLRIGLAVTLMVELLQLVMLTRYCDLTDVVTGTAAVLLGWWLVRKVREAGSANRPGNWVAETWNTLRVRTSHAGARPWLVLATAWAVFLIVLNWQPYHFSLNPRDFLESDPNLSEENTAVHGLRRMSWAPLVDYYWGSRYQALDQFVMRSLAMAPLGICLALAFGKREKQGARRMLLIAAALGLVIETGQYFIPERHPGTTDILIGIAGAWLAFHLTRHVANALQTGPVALGEGRYSYGDNYWQSFPTSVPRSGPRPRESSAADFSPLADPQEDLLEALLNWLVKLPSWLALTIICVTAVTVTLGLALLLGR
ncbi:MAG TPA: VanZ family protein [Gemmataceae bacterium]|nr:VanZ family protein [Gemmataceae bacterium]